jgi:NTP pyrophosphatase (non-canonical NTP hydrolase)
MMDDQTKEILTILQEEAAEVIVEISKCIRFGMTEDNLDRLNKELGDLGLMIDLLIDEHIGVTGSKIFQAKENKLKKLSVYSNIKLKGYNER